MSGLLKIKSIVTLLLVVTLVTTVLVSLFTEVKVNDSFIGLFGTAVGAAIGSLFAKKDAEQ